MTLAIDRNRNRTEAVNELRRQLPRLEGFSTEARGLSFGVSTLDSHLPQGGLTFGALHEVVPEGDDNRPAAFGFLTALLGCMPRTGPLLLVMPARDFASSGRPHGHGLNALGLEPGRVILVETPDKKQTLWAMEEALRSGAPAAVAGVIEDLDLRTSQRLHLAAREFALPLMLLRPARTLEASAAATRWHVSAARAARDCFGLIAYRRWHLRLDRCRNGRTGEWLVEFDHVAHRFSLVTAMANPAFSCSAGAQSRA
jgi:protein ImuA